MMFLNIRFPIPCSSGQHSSRSEYTALLKDRQAVATRDCHSEGLGLEVGGLETCRTAHDRF
jgi:hypothetical protein